MCALPAAPFLWQKVRFWRRDAQSFNRNSFAQVAMCVGLIDFSTCYTRIFHVDFAI